MIISSIGESRTICLMCTSTVIIGIIATALLMPNITNAFAGDNAPRDPFTEKERESGFYHENGYAISLQSKRPAINPDFAPDYSCIFDVYQLKCIPGSEQECPESFGNNEDYTCFSHEYWEGCPNGYHSVDGDETGQCYPNSESCPDHGLGYPSMMLLTDRLSKTDQCMPSGYVCNLDEHKEKEYCIEYKNARQRQLAQPDN